MECLNISILCTLTERRSCERMREELLEKLAQFSRAIELCLSIDVVTLPFTIEDVPEMLVKLPAIAIVSGGHVKLFELGKESDVLAVDHVLRSAQVLTAEAMSL